jgi:hypothetical protein
VRLAVEGAPTQPTAVGYFATDKRSTREPVRPALAAIETAIV